MSKCVRHIALSQFSGEKRRRTMRQFIVGERTYELHPVFTNSYFVLKEFGEQIEADMGRREAEYLLEHQQDMPFRARKDIALVFPDWVSDNQVAYIAWQQAEDAGRWILKFWPTGQNFNEQQMKGAPCLVRRIR